MISIKNQAGIGLIETAVTFLIIAGAVIALVRFQSQLAYSSNVSQQQNDALILAMNRVEQLRDFSILTGTGSYQAIASGSSTSTATSAVYTLTWTVTNNTNPNYKVINVTVSWTDRQNSNRSIQLSARVAGIDPAYSATIM